MAKNIEKKIETYYITEDQMPRVNTYLSLQAKMEWVEWVAERCLDRVNINASYGDTPLDIPPMYKENTELKSRYLMGAFVKLYLHWNWEVGEDEDELLLPKDEYDKWAGGHIFAQIEKFKSNKDLRDICFNLLNDFKDLELRLKAEIRDKMAIMNDPVMRQMMAMQMSMTPEAMEKAINELNEARDELAEYQKNRQEIMEEMMNEEKTDES